MKKIVGLCLLTVFFFAISVLQAQINQIPDSSVAPQNRAVCGYNPSKFKEPGFRIATPDGISVTSMPKGTYPASAIFHCGKFDLYYEDVALANGLGFDAPAGVGATRRNTLCAVYQYVQSIFDFNSVPAGDPITIEVQETPPASTVTYLAIGGATYPNSALPGIYNGSVLNHVLTGASPVPALFDGTMVVNFNTYTFYNDIPFPIPNCNYDLFTVCLHEVGHQLGFNSFLREDGLFNPVSAFGNDQYTLFDWQNIWHGDINNPATFEKLVTGTMAIPQINPAIASPTNYLRDEKLWLNNNGRFLDNLPIYSGVYLPDFATALFSSLTIGSVASHMDGEYVSFTKRFSLSPGFMKKHSMQPYVDFGEDRREYSEQEIRIFEQLGYNLNPLYAVSTSLNGVTANAIIINTNHTPFTTKPVTNFNCCTTAAQPYPDLTQLPDFAISNNGVPLVINLAADATLNDIDGDPISVQNNTIYNIRGCGNGNNHNQLTVGPGGTTITYLPRPDFIGRAQFGFYLYDGKERGSFMIYTIDVTAGPAFVNVPNVNTPVGSTELILNGDFEQGLEIRRNSTAPEEAIVSTPLQFAREEGLYFTGYIMGDAHPLQYVNFPFTTSSGIIVGSSEKNCAALSTPIRFGSFPFSYPNFWNHPAPPAGYRYSYITGSHNYNTIATPLQKCHRYIATFNVNFQNTGLAVGSVYHFNLDIDNAVSFPGLITNQTVPVAITVGTGWQTIVVPFYYCSTVPGNYLNFVSISGQRVYYDNVSLVEDLAPPALSASITAGATSLCSGISTVLTTTVNNAACNLTYTWAPITASTANVTVTPTATTTYTVTVNDECQSVSSTITINTLVPIPAIISTLPGICSGDIINIAGYLSPAGGTFSGPGISSSGIFNSTAAGGPGTYSITYHFIDLNGCNNTTTFTINVSGACCTAPTIVPSAGANSSSYGGSFAGSTIAVNGTLTINNNFFMTNQLFLFAPNVKIIILAGKTLTISKCDLYSCSTQMWDGIEIQPGGTLILQNKSLIEDAKIAVLSDNTGGTPATIANFIIDKTTFNRNYIGVKVINYTLTTMHPGQITNTTFDSQPSTTSTVNTSLLDAPYASQVAEFGVELNSVSSITVGNAASVINQNRFRYLRVGIRSQGSEYYVLNNDFRNNFPTSICITPFPTPPGFSCPVVGWAIWNTKTKCIVGGYAVNEANNFQDLSNGILHENGYYLDVFKNTFTNISSSSFMVNSIAVFTRNFNQATITISDNDLKTLENGLVHRNNFGTSYTVKKNLFKDFTQTAVYAYQNTSGNILVSLNDFNQSTTSSYNGNIAVNISNAVLPLTSSPFVKIDQNNIFRVNKGIYLTDINRPQVLNNTIGFKNTITPLLPNFYYGIRAQNGNLENILQNTIYRGLPVPALSFEPSVYGISVETNASNTSVSENSITRMGTGLRFRSYFTGNSSVRCNIMTNNWSGLTLDAVYIGQQGEPVSGFYPQGVANDNIWSTIPVSMTGSVSVRGLGAYTAVPFYTRTATYGFCPSAGNIVPSFTIFTSSNTPPQLPVPAAATNCSNICYNPPCMHTALVKIARNLNPFDLITGNERLLMQEGLVKAVLADSIPPDTTTADGHDLQLYVDTTLANSDVGKIIMVSNKYSSGDTLGAIALNSTIDPKNCAADYHKIVNSIFFNTWAHGIFEFSAGDYNTLHDIAILDPLICGTAVYDARVMIDLDVNDFSESAHSMENTSDNGVSDKVGILYPNPAQSACTYEAELGDSQTGMLILYDLNGKLISSYKLNAGANKILIDLSDWSNGIYLYKILINGEIYDYKKLVIAK